MRKPVIVLMSLLLVALVVGGCAGGGDTCTICGVYWDQGDPTQFLELKKNGIFETALVRGIWYVRGSEITFVTGAGPFTGRVEGSRVIIGDGVFVKKGT